MANIAYVGPTLVYEGRTHFWSDWWGDYIVSHESDGNDIINGSEVSILVIDPPVFDELGGFQDSNNVSSIHVYEYKEGVATLTVNYAWVAHTEDVNRGWVNQLFDIGNPNRIMPVDFQPPYSFPYQHSGDLNSGEPLSYPEDHVGAQFNPEQRPTLGYPQ